MTWCTGCVVSVQGVRLCEGGTVIGEVYIGCGESTGGLGGVKREL